MLPRAASSARRRRVHARRAAASLLVWTGARASLADDSAGRQALAEELFRSAKALMIDHRYAEACPKLVESQRLDPGGGTLLTLALCHEAEGRSASAWAEFNESLEMARRDGREDRAAIAREHAGALAPVLNRVYLEVAPATTGLLGLRVRLDGALLGTGSFGVWLPVDRGDHRLEVSAPQKASFVRPFRVGGTSSRISLQIPALADLVPTRPAAPPHADRRRTTGYVVAGVGAALLLGGTIAGLRAMSDARAANDACPQPRCTSHDAVTRSGRAAAEATLSDLAFGLGAVAVGLGAYWSLTATRTPTTAMAAARFTW